MASLEKIKRTFGEYFNNLDGDFHDNQARIQENCPVGIDGEWYQVSSSDNTADQTKRFDSTQHMILALREVGNGQKNSFCDFEL